MSGQTAEMIMAARVALGIQYSALLSLKMQTRTTAVVKRPDNGDFTLQAEFTAVRLSKSKSVVKGREARDAGHTTWRPRRPWCERMS